ncbi:MAG: hypothetical protein U0936_11305 [Planctomycetaceae bacterium]
MNTQVGTNETHRRTMLVAAFLAWMFAGLENSLFILIHRQMMLELLGSATPEKLITEWFAWFQSAFLFWSRLRLQIFRGIGRSNQANSCHGGRCFRPVYSGLTLYLLRA